MTKTHGLSYKHPLYERWKGMRSRCNNLNHPSFHRYGGRGIGICDRWNDFAAFVADMEPSWPGDSWEIHRVDNDQGYAPDNCVWVLKPEHMGLPKTEQHRAAIGAAHKGRKHTPEQVRKQADAQRFQFDADWLWEMYVGNEMSCQAIAEEAGCQRSTVHRALKRFGIPTRPRRGSVDRDVNRSPRDIAICRENVKTKATTGIEPVHQVAREMEGT